MRIHLKPLFLLVILTTLIWLLNVLVLKQPTNQGNWELGQDHLTQIAYLDSNIRIDNLRDFHYSGEQMTGFDYTSRIVNPSHITQVWLVVEPFSKIKAIAHTYFVFDFSDSNPVVVSVEARREKHQDYSPFLGVFNQYQLIYIWGNETDETIRRVTLEHNKLYMYPLLISQNGARDLFLQLANTTNSLISSPRFYNTLTSNCTNELAKAANAVKPGTIPFNKALFFPGYSAQELYKLKLIPTDAPLEVVTNRFYISDIVTKYANDAEFSKKLRSELKY